MPPAVAPVVPSLLAALASVPDHRRAAGRRHALPTVLTFVCCGMLCGCKSLLALAEWGRANEAWCCAVFGFRRRTPCVNTLHRVLRGLDVGAFEAALRAWLAPQLGAPVPLEPIAIDGKAVRGAKAQPLPGAYLLSAFASRRGAVLAQLAIGEPENELGRRLRLNVPRLGQLASDLRLLVHLRPIATERLDGVREAAALHGIGITSGRGWRRNPPWTRSPTRCAYQSARSAPGA